VLREGSGRDAFDGGIVVGAIVGLDLERWEGEKREGERRRR